MHLKATNSKSHSKEVEPVFLGLCKSGITGRKIAHALRVSPAMVSKWRRGKSIIPGKVQIFLTLMLADLSIRTSEYPLCYQYGCQMP